MSFLTSMCNASVPLYRSEDMSYVSLTITNDAAHDTLLELGKFGKLHVVDLSAGKEGSSSTGTPSKQHLTYKKRLADCLFWEKKFVSFREEMKRRDVPLPADDTPTQEIKAADLMEEVAAFLDPIEKELVLSAGFQKDNLRQMSEIIERRHVLRVCSQEVQLGSAVDELKANQAANQASASDGQEAYVSMPFLDSIEMESKSAHGGGDDGRLRNLLCGVIPVESMDQMKRMLYRISRGNAMARFRDLPEKIVDPATGEQQLKSVFWIVFLGQQLNSRIRKMCDIIHATIYDLPVDSGEEQQRLLAHLNRELQDKESVNSRTEEAIFQLLSRLAGGEAASSTSPLMDWEHALMREKMICNILMKSHFYLTLIAIEGWCPTAELTELKDVIRSAVIGTGHPPAAVEINPVSPLRAPSTAPTYFRLNKFTATFQGIVDTYGVPRYKEVNPGLFTIITFPFLFGVMYGDIGHGVLITLFAYYMVYHEQRIERSKRAGTLGEIPTMAFGGRYVMLLMGLFAIFCGVIYNDCLSIPTALYTSQWIDTGGEELVRNPDTVYPIGVDYHWYHKSNELAFFNGMKMKTSVILGVVQMTFGIFLSLNNHRYFNNTRAVYWEFLPRLTFLMCTFGYMCFMIIYKWTIDWDANQQSNFAPGDACYVAVKTDAPPIGCSPPNLIQVMIAMFLSPGSVDVDKRLYVGQAAVQSVLLLLAVFSVPVMLCCVPCLNKRDYKRSLLSKAHHGSSGNGSYGSQGSDSDLHAYSSFNSPTSSAARNGGLKNGSSSSDLRPHTDQETFAMGSDSESYQVHGSNDEREEKHSAAAAAVPASSGHGHGGHGDAEYSFSDELIHNSIHTIEFVLGCVSNTASYLRLWALSLAHAQLASVFWEKMVLQYGIANGAVFSFIGFGVWAAATFAVLLCMDTLECFLHALRLHWVEFQNKFYYADGKPFEPFAFTPSDY